MALAVSLASLWSLTASGRGCVCAPPRVRRLRGAVVCADGGHHGARGRRAGLELRQRQPAGAGEGRGPSARVGRGGGGAGERVAGRSGSFLGRGACCGVLAVAGARLARDVTQPAEERPRGEQRLWSTLTLAARQPHPVATWMQVNTYRVSNSDSLAASQTNPFALLTGVARVGPSVVVCFTRLLNEPNATVSSTLDPNSERGSLLVGCLAPTLAALSPASQHRSTAASAGREAPRLPAPWCLRRLWSLPQRLGRAAGWCEQTACRRRRVPPPRRP